MAVFDSEARPRPFLPRARRARPLAEPVSVVEVQYWARPGFRLRVAFLGTVALTAFAILGLRLWSLQVIQGPRFQAAAHRQSVRFHYFQTPRGSIVDARGRVLATAVPRLAVALAPEAIGSDGEHGWQPSRRGRSVIGRLSKLVHVPPGRLANRLRRGHVRDPWTPAVVVPHVPRGLAFFLDEHRRAFPGLEIVAVPDRRYPQGAGGSEFVGLLGEIDSAELGKRRFKAYRPGSLVGQSGVERTYERLLGGRLARQTVPVDVTGRPIGDPRAIRMPRAARSLQLTVDLRLQRAAEAAIRHGIALARANGHYDAQAGAAVALDARDGSLYALATYPDFNQRRAATERKYYSRLLRGSEAGATLLNRATQGVYPAGSTFKPIVAEAAMQAGVLSPWSVLQCTGSLTIGNTVFHNVEAGINAPLTLPQALSMSCDTWFYRVGQLLYRRQLENGSLDLQRWARRLGFGGPTGLDVPGEAGGVVPTPAWLKRTFTRPWERIWYEGTTVNLSIGQGYLAVTPLQLAVAYAALANGGKVVRPHVAKAVLDARGRVVRRLKFPPLRRLRLTGLEAIRSGLYSAAHSGTSAAVFSDFQPAVAGKTGTAETPGGSDHSWYASWAPAGRPRLVVVVLIEHGGFGAEAAAPAARDIYRAFFQR